MAAGGSTRDLECGSLQVPVEPLPRDGSSALPESRLRLFTLNTLLSLWAGPDFRRPSFALQHIPRRRLISPYI